MAEKKLPEATTPQDREAAVGSVNLTSVIDQLAQMVNMDPAAYNEIARETTSGTAKKKLTESEYAFFMARCASMGLNPLLHEVFAFAKEGKVTVAVEHAGWVKLANKREDYNGFTEEHILDASGNLLAIKGRVHSKLWENPVEHTVYMSDFYRNTPAWQSTRNHMLAIKCFNHSIKKAFGYSDCIDPDDAERWASIGESSVSPKSMPEMEDATPKETAPPTPTPPPVASPPPQPAPPPKTGGATQLSSAQRGYLWGLWKQHTGIKKDDKLKEAWAMFCGDRGTPNPGYDDLKPLLDKWAITDRDKNSKPPEDISEITAFMECHPEFNPAAGGEAASTSSPAPPDGALNLINGSPYPDEMPVNLADQGDLLALIDASVMDAAKGKKLKRADVVKIAEERFSLGLANLDLQKWKIIWLHILTLKG